MYCIIQYMYELKQILADTADWKKKILKEFNV